MNVIIRVEPSKELSRMLGFPHFIEKKVDFDSIKMHLTPQNIKDMEDGKEIYANIPVIGEE